MRCGQCEFQCDRRLRWLEALISVHIWSPYWTETEGARETSSQRGLWVISPPCSRTDSKDSGQEYQTERLSWSVYKPQRYKLALLSEIAPLQFCHRSQSGDNASSSCLMLFTSLCSIIILAMIDNTRECINVSVSHPKVIVLKWLTESFSIVSNVHVGSLKALRRLQIRLLWGPSRINGTILSSPNHKRQRGLTGQGFYWETHMNWHFISFKWSSKWNVGTLAPPLKLPFISFYVLICVNY